jgi:hypothetical protein
VTTKEYVIHRPDGPKAALGSASNLSILRPCQSAIRPPNEENWTSNNPAPADPRFGAWGKQKCEDTGPLTRARIETVEEDPLQRRLISWRSP